MLWRVSDSVNSAALPTHEGLDSVCVRCATVVLQLPLSACDPHGLIDHSNDKLRCHVDSPGDAITTRQLLTSAQRLVHGRPGMSTAVLQGIHKVKSALRSGAVVYELDLICHA
jgi:hypothetical protein